MPDNNALPRVMLIPDSINWILGTWAKQIVKWNSHHYNFVIVPYGEIRENPELFFSLLPEVDAVHCLSQSAFPTVLEKIEQSSARNVPLISTIHHIVHWSQIEACLRADRIMVVCEQFRQALLNAAVPTEKVTLIYNGVDSAFFAPMDRRLAKEKFGIPAEAFTIGFSAKASSNHDGRKGIDVFEGVLARLAAAGRDTNVIITGPGWEKVVAKNQREQNRIHYFRYLPDVAMPAFYNALDVFLVTARVEGGPVPPLEAMSCGTPVVTTPVGTMRDFIQDGENGLLVPFDDAEATVAALQRLSRDPVLANRLGDRGRETVGQQLQWQQTTTQVASLYGNKRITERKDLQFPDLSLLSLRLIENDERRWRRRHNLESPRTQTIRDAIMPLVESARRRFFFRGV
jgi:glycosyltransferase involved in cell wall biosynthesis